MKHAFGLVINSRLAVLLAMCLAGPAAAEGPLTALRPTMRPIITLASLTVVEPAAASLRPMARPQSLSPVPVSAQVAPRQTVPQYERAELPFRALAAGGHLLGQVSIGLIRPQAVLPAPDATLSESAAPVTVTTVLTAPVSPVINVMQQPGIRLVARNSDAAFWVAQPLAQAPLRPKSRPQRQLRAVPIPVPVSGPDLVPASMLSAVLPNGQTAPVATPDYSPLAVAIAFRPPPRPAGVTRAAAAVQAERARGSVCSNPQIQGEALSRIDGPGACGISHPVRVRSVAGVRLSTPATIDCQTAQALARWVQRSAIPAIGNTGGGLAGLRVVSHYSCRTRNSQPGARLSEHSFGRAIDIAGFQLRNGTEISVLNGWNSSNGARLRRMHDQACGTFGTVLGPNANRFHADHFHFDTANYRSGSYCR